MLQKVALGSSQTYRPDIDGLRAIAVIAVVVYHFGLRAVPGGFVGVDVFFVISGYLITSILYREIVDQTFSFWQFYARRIRRILPALSVVLLASFMLGWFLLLPSDYVELAEQTAYAAFGLSNFYFLGHTGYFDRAAEMQPLLHTWSLGVEEQFYLIWPLLFLCLWRSCGGHVRRVLMVLALVSVASFLWSSYAAFAYPESAFFMLPSRAWELALGGAVALLPALAARTAKTWDIAGLLLVGGSLLALNHNTPFPGAAALPVCLGTALLIWPKEAPSPVSRLLADRRLVKLGLMSYSLYLWHWPLLVFFRQYLNEKMPKTHESLALIGVALALSWVTWKYVECPVRRSRKVSAIFGAVASAGLACGLGCVTIWTAGFAFRVDPRASELDAFKHMRSTTQLELDCGRLPAGQAFDACLSRRPGKSNVLLIGDSHAEHFARALQDNYPDVKVTVATASGCRPVLGNAEHGGKCSALFDPIYQSLLPSGAFDAVILSACWRAGQAELLPETVRNASRFVKDVIVLGQTLEYTHSLPDILANPLLLRRPLELSAARKYRSSKEVDDAVRKSLVGTSARYVSVIDEICPNGAESCQVLTADGTPFAYDYGHLTYAASNHLVAGFKAHGLALAHQ